MRAHMWNTPLHVAADCVERFQLAVRGRSAPTAILGYCSERDDPNNEVYVKRRESALPCQSEAMSFGNCSFLDFPFHSEKTSSDLDGRLLRHSSPPRWLFAGRQKVPSEKATFVIVT
jgi:hypothetical protein